MLSSVLNLKVGIVNNGAWIMKIACINIASED
jgi:hypothetical protein